MKIKFFIVLISISQFFYVAMAAENLAVKNDFSEPPSALSSLSPIAHREFAEKKFSDHAFSSAAENYAAYLTTENNPDFIAQLHYAICLYELQRADEALKILRELLTRSVNQLPDRAAVNYYAGLAARELADLPAAENYLLAAANANSPAFSPPALFTLGEIFNEQRRFAEAAKTYTALTEQYPESELSASAKFAGGKAQYQTGELTAAIANFRSLLDNENPDLQRRARYQLIIALTDSGNLTEAFALAEQMVNSAATNEFRDRVNFLIAAIYFAQKNAELADTVLQKISDTAAAANFSDRTAWLKLWMAYQRKNYGEIIRLAAAPDTSKNPLSEDFLYLSARAAFAMNDYSGATQKLAQVRDHAGKWANTAALELAVALEKNRQFAEAAAAYQWLREHNPAAPHTIEIDLGRMLMNAERYEAALKIWEKIARADDFSPEQRTDIFFQRANAYFNLKQFGNLRSACEQLLREFPQSKNAPNALFWLLWRDVEEKKSTALARCDNFLQRYPAHHLTAAVRYYRGVALLQLGRLEKAAAIFYDLALVDEKLSGDELLWLALQLRKQGDMEKAAEIFRRLLAYETKTPLQINGLLGIAAIYREQQQWQNAAECYRKISSLLPLLRAAPAQIAALTNEMNFGITATARELGDLTTAETTIAQIKLLPNDPRIADLYYERGLLAAAKNQHAEAAEWLLRVGLLSGDEQLAGRALWSAAQESLANHDAARARICYEELAGNLTDSFGGIYPNNEYVKMALRELNN